MVVAGRVVAMAAAVSPAAPDRAPGEVALLGVCGAALVAVAALLIRRGRVRRWRPGRALLDAVRGNRRTSVEKTAVGDGPDDSDVCATRPDPAWLDDVRAGSAEDADPDAVVDADGSADGSRWRPQAGVLVPAAVVVLLAGGIGMAVVMGGSGHGRASGGSAAAGVDPGPGQLQSANASPSSPRPGKHPANGAHAAASPGPGKSPGHGGAAAATGSGSSGSSASPHTPTSPATSPPANSPPSAPTLVLPAQSIELQPTTSLDPAYVGSFTITAEGGAVSYTIAVPTAAGGTDVTITPSSGTLSEGQQATITVSMDLPASYVTVDPGGTVQFTWVHGHVN
jgi:hypothetical protein